jgi:two-component system, OmpR family, sensor kinase
LTRLPIRTRLTLVFACIMATVLLATGGLLYVRVGTSLDHTVDEGLEARSAEVTGAAKQGSVAGAVLPDDQDEQFAQLLDLEGKVLDATGRVADEAVLAPDQLARVVRDRVAWSTRGGVPGLNGTARILARRLESPDGSRILVVGASLGERDATVRRLLEELFIVGPAALLLASLRGYWVASAALRPVESMRAEAAAISAAAPGRRLTLPRPRDEVRRLGETLNATLEKLEAALRLERSFVADASHEMRSPVARLNTELELALRHPREASELEAAIRSASVEARLLATLTENLLLLARSDHGALPLRQAPVRVASILETVAGRFREEAFRTGRRIDVDGADPFAISADEVQLEQALGNAVENALHHGQGTVTLRALKRPGGLELHVIDEGGGFPVEFLPRAFVRFARAEEGRTSAGTGLGLSIFEAIATAHGGSAHLANRENGGADVWIFLPDADADADADG